MQAQVRNAEVVGVAEIERAGTYEPGRVRPRMQQCGDLELHLAVGGVRHRSHVVLAIPDLVVHIEAQLTAPLDQSGQLRWRGAEHHGAHGGSAYPWPVARDRFGRKMPG